MAPAPAVAGPAGTSEAVALWHQLRAAIDPGQTLLSRSCLDALLPIAVDGDALVVQDTNGSGEYVMRNLADQLGEHANACTAGAVVTVRRVPPPSSGIG